MPTTPFSFFQRGFTYLGPGIMLQLPLSPPPLGPLVPISHHGMSAVNRYSKAFNPATHSLEFICRNIAEAFLASGHTQFKEGGGVSTQHAQSACA